MNGFVRRPFDLSDRRITAPETFFQQRRLRREFLASLGRSIGTAAGASLIGSLAFSAAGCAPEPAEIEKAGRSEPVTKSYGGRYPAPRSATFEYGRPETSKYEASRFTNFYEFSSSKATFRYVDRFEPLPWKVSVDGLCNAPREFDLDDLYNLAPLEERAYRHRCVETWAMCVPWTGFALHHLLKVVDPKPEAKFVRFETFLRPDQAPNQDDTSNPWPYTEGLTIDEARNELAFLTLGVYGEPLPKQHGAPVRLVAPWKYGFKSAKSIVKITLTDQQPPTFWNTLIPHEYAFEANVDPTVPHPRWSQRREHMLDTQELFDTVKYNGYGDWVAALYPA